MTEIGTHTLLVGMQIGGTTSERNLTILKKITHIYLPFDPVVTSLGLCITDIHWEISENMCAQSYCVTISNSKRLETIQIFILI